MLNLDPHFHTPALDGIYVFDVKGGLAFRRVPPPSDAEVAGVVDRIHRWVARLMERRGLGPQVDPAEADMLRHDEPFLAELYSAAVSGRIAIGRRAGKPVARVGEAVDVEDAVLPAGLPCAAVAGYSLHAGVCVPACGSSRSAGLEVDMIARYRKLQGSHAGGVGGVPAGSHCSQAA